MTSKHSTTKSETHSEGCPQQMSQPELLSGAREGQKARSHRWETRKEKILAKESVQKAREGPVDLFIAWVWGLVLFWETRK